MMLKSPNKILGIPTSTTEIFHLAISWLCVSLAFAIAFGGLTDKLLGYMFLTAITVGFGFILHELAHKIIAQQFGCWAEFRSNFGMLIFAIFMPILIPGFVFAAPGATYIHGVIKKSQNGIISIAGPIMNVVLGLGFLILYLNGNSIGLMGFRVNSFLALFNLIPFGFFDGKKVFDWNVLIWGISVVICLVLVIISIGISGLNA